MLWNGGKWIIFATFFYFWRTEHDLDGKWSEICRNSNLTDVCFRSSRSSTPRLLMRSPLSPRAVFSRWYWNSWFLQQIQSVRDRKWFFELLFSYARNTALRTIFNMFFLEQKLSSSCYPWIKKCSQFSSFRECKGTSLASFICLLFFLSFVLIFSDLFSSFSRT